MRKVAVWILLAGFVFVFFSINLLGTDLLLNPVGYLLIWNAAKALQKQDGLFGLSPLWAFLLVACSIIGLFTSSFFSFLPSWLVPALETLLQMLLYAQLLWGFARLLQSQNQNNDKLFALVTLAVCLLGCLISLIPSAALFLQYAIVVPGGLYWGSIWLGRILLLAFLGRLAFLFGRQQPA